METKSRVYGKNDVMLGIGAIIGAYLYVDWFSNMFWDWEGMFFLGVSFLLVAIMVAVFRIREHKKMDGESMLYFGFVCAAGLWMLFSTWFDESLEAGQLTFYIFLFAHMMMIYWLLTVNQNRLNNDTGEEMIGDFIRGGLSLPLSHFGCLFTMLTGKIKRVFLKKEESRKKSSNMAPVWAGILFSIPCLVIIIPLLLQIDSAFLEGFSWFYSFFVRASSEVFEWLNVWKIFFVVIISSYLFGLIYGAANCYMEKNTQEYEEVKEELSANPISLVSFLSVIDGVYLLFFATKLSGAAASIDQAKMGRLVYSEYARSGFFELCLIVFINFVLFSIVKYLSKNDHKYVKIVMGLLGFETLGFILLAFSKMQLYISVYGFTFRRVFTCWFMAICFYAFVLQIISLKKNLKVVKSVLALSGITFLLLAYSNMGWWMTALNQLYGMG